jgi:hypothetical protein
VEAAVLMPSVLLVFALLTQPICLFYTQTLMHGAAAEAARAVLTARNDAELSACREYALRRLAAVPEVPLFHAGGQDDWQVEVTREGLGSVHVSIRGHARPLPLFATVVGALKGRDGVGVVLSCEVTERMRPSWLGGDYGEWTGVWGA